VGAGIIVLAFGPFANLEAGASTVVTKLGTRTPKGVAHSAEVPFVEADFKDAPTLMGRLAAALGADASATTVRSWLKTPPKAFLAMLGSAPIYLTPETDEVKLLQLADAAQEAAEGEAPPLMLGAVFVNSVSSSSAAAAASASASASARSSNSGRNGSTGGGGVVGFNKRASASKEVVSLLEEEDGEDDEEVEVVEAPGEILEADVLVRTTVHRVQAQGGGGPIYKVKTTGNTTTTMTIRDAEGASRIFVCYRCLRCLPCLAPRAHYLPPLTTITTTITTTTYTNTTTNTTTTTTTTTNRARELELRRPLLPRAAGAGDARLQGRPQAVLRPQRLLLLGDGAAEFRRGDHPQVQRPLDQGSVLGGLGPQAPPRDRAGGEGRQWAHRSRAV
jgi:hypothetical protein